MRRAVVVAAALALSPSACSDDRPAERSAEDNAALGGEAAARVGDERIPLGLVESVARAQRISPREAARRLVDDEIAAGAARARGVDRAPPAAWLLVAARGRMTADRLLEEARRKGPPTDDEVKALSEVHWREVERPPSVRVIHALAERPASGGDAAALRAKETAAELRAAVLSATSDAEFEEKANAVRPKEGVKVKVQRLPAFTEDGWIVEGDGRMLESFSRPAFALAQPGSTSSELVETKFGWHVIRLVERLPEQRVDFETRRVTFADEVYARRAHELLEARLNELRAAMPVSVSPSAEQLMRSVSARTSEQAKQEP